MSLFCPLFLKGLVSGSRLLEREGGFLFSALEKASGQKEGSRLSAGDWIPEIRADSGRPSHSSPVAFPEWRQEGRHPK